MLFGWQIGLEVLSAFISGFYQPVSDFGDWAQNSFVIRQGLLNQHVLAVVLFCGISDALLICLGVLGLGTSLWRLFLSILGLDVWAIGAVAGFMRWGG